MLLTVSKRISARKLWKTDNVCERNVKKLAWYKTIHIIECAGVIVVHGVSSLFLCIYDEYEVFHSYKVCVGSYTDLYCVTMQWMEPCAVFCGAGNTGHVKSLFTCQKVSDLVWVALLFNVHNMCIQCWNDFKTSELILLYMYYQLILVACEYLKGIGAGNTGPTVSLRYNIVNLTL